MCVIYSETVKQHLKHWKETENALCKKFVSIFSKCHQRQIGCFAFCPQHIVAYWYNKYAKVCSSK